MAELVGGLKEEDVVAKSGDKEVESSTAATGRIATATSGSKGSKGPSKVRRKPVKSSCTLDSYCSIGRDSARSSVDSTASEASSISNVSIASSGSSYYISMPTRPPPPIPVSEHAHSFSLPSVQPLNCNRLPEVRQRPPSPQHGHRSVSSPTRTTKQWQLFPAQRNKLETPRILRPGRPQTEDRRASLPPIQFKQQPISEPVFQPLSSISLSKPLPKEPKTPIKKKSTKSISYTAMLDFTPSSRSPPSPILEPRKLVGSNGYEIPDLLQGTKTNTTPKKPSSSKSSPTRDRKFSISSFLSDQRRSPSTSPITSPSAKPLIVTKPDPSYRGGYESSSDSEEVFSSPDIRSPVFRPPIISSPASPKRPPRPRISTDFSVEPPLNIQQVPLRQVELVSGVDVQSAEITEILDLYLTEIVADATARGVMSEGLKAFLESPVGKDWEVVRELERQGSLS